MVGFPLATIAISASVLSSLLIITSTAALSHTVNSRATSYQTTSGKKYKTNNNINSIPNRRLSPPFPNGPCGGSIVTLPKEDTYGISERLNGNSFVLPPRDIQVWLPPEYTTTAQQHPVLFTHDGQNCMDDCDSWTGTSWRMMGALTRLQERGLLQGPTPIVVLLPSAKDDIIPGIVRRRHMEYAGDGVFAEAHYEFIAKTVKPLVDALFNTSPTENYAIGTSMGGQASLQLLLRYPELFQGAACLSPAFDPATFAAVVQQRSLLKKKKVYLDIGGDIGDEKVPFLDLLDHVTQEHWWNPGYFWLDTQLQPAVEAMKWTLEMAGVNVDYQQVAGGRHNERAWSQRIDLPLLHLLGKKP